MKENTDYEIIPDMNDDKAWNVRILKGAFTETVIKYGVVKFNSEDILFNFDIIFIPGRMEIDTFNYFFEKL